MDFTILGTLTIVSAAVSLLVQAIKKHLGGGWTIGALIVISLVVGGLYVFFQSHSNYWATVLQVLLGANAVYNFVIQWFEKPTPT